MTDLSFPGGGLLVVFVIHICIAWERRFSCARHEPNWLKKPLVVC